VGVPGHCKGAGLDAFRYCFQLKQCYNSMIISLFLPSFLELYLSLATAREIGDDVDLKVLTVIHVYFQALNLS